MAEKKQRVSGSTVDSTAHAIETEVGNVLRTIGSNGDLMHLMNEFIQEKYGFRIRQHRYSRKPGEVRISISPRTGQAETILKIFNLRPLTERIAMVRYMRSTLAAYFQLQGHDNITHGLTPYNMNLWEQQLMADYWLAHKAILPRLKGDLTNEVMKFVGRGYEFMPGMKKGFF